LSQIYPIDRKLLEEFFKSDPIVYLKSPVLGSDEPIMPSVEERKKGKIPDENLGLWKEFNMVKELVQDLITEPKN